MGAAAETVRDGVHYGFWMRRSSSWSCWSGSQIGRQLERRIEGPAFARFLFNNSRAGLFWLPIRLF